MTPVKPGEAPKASATPRVKSTLPPVLSTERAYGLESVGQPILPTDEVLGPLADLAAPQGLEKEVLPKIQSFLDALLEGRLDKASLSPGQEALVGLGARSLLTGTRPKAYLIGRILITGEENGLGASASFSLLYPQEDPGRPAPRASGELVLSRGVDGWGVDSLSLKAGG